MTQNSNMIEHNWHTAKMGAIDAMRSFLIRNFQNVDQIGILDQFEAGLIEEKTFN